MRAAFAGAVLLIGVLAAWLIAGRATGDSRTPARDLDQAAFQEGTGIRIVRVAVTAGGGMIDLRYQVVDPDKALVVHSTSPKLVDEKSKQVVSTLFMGHSHEGQPKAGYTYPLLLVNGGGLLEPGSVVSVVIDDVRLEHVTVE